MSIPYHMLECPACRAGHAQWVHRLNPLDETLIERKSHFLQGRYENIYLKLNAIAELDAVVQQALHIGAKFLQRDYASLRIGYWLNIMRHGDETLPHTHDDNDELLSGCYYVQTPEGSGKLILKQQSNSMSIEPRAGFFILFPPDVEHAVTRHESHQTRISVGFNIGPRI